MQQPQPTLPFAPAIGFARNRETARAYWMLDLLWLVLVDGHETGGAFSVMEQWMRQGSGPPIPHIHPIDEWFYVMEGEMTVELGDQTIIGRRRRFLVDSTRHGAPIQGNEPRMPGAQRLHAGGLRASDHRPRQAGGAARVAAANGPAGSDYDRQGLQQLLVRGGPGRLGAVPPGNTMSARLRRRRPPLVVDAADAARPRRRGDRVKRRELFGSKKAP